MTLPPLFISVTGLLARLSEERHCCRLTALCLVLPLCARGPGVYLKHGRLRFYKDPDSARWFHRGLHKFTSNETAFRGAVRHQAQFALHSSLPLVSTQKRAFLLLTVGSCNLSKQRGQIKINKPSSGGRQQKGKDFSRLDLCHSEKPSR